MRHTSENPVGSEMRKKLEGLKLQALYGNNPNNKPNNSEGKKALREWEVWSAQRGKSEDAAAAEYIQTIKNIIHEE